MKIPENVGAGEGRTMLTDQVPLRLGILRGLSQFFERQTDKTGQLLCPTHRVEHTGKLIDAALINLQCWRLMRDDEYLEFARRQALRAVDHFRAPVFLPESGDCADVLATLLAEAPFLFDESESARCRQALQQHVEGFLLASAHEDLLACPGVARAAALLGRDDWRQGALAGCARALDALAGDGLAAEGEQGRVPAIVLSVHEALGEPLSEASRERLRAALDALVALRDGEGRKLQSEGYEVASHPFDVYALHTGARLLERPLYRNEAGSAMQEWIAHVDAMDGGVLSHRGRGRAALCRIVINADAAWLTRVIHDVPLQRARREPVCFDLRASGLLHVERPLYTALLRHGQLRSPWQSSAFRCRSGPLWSKVSWSARYTSQSWDGQSARFSGVLADGSGAALPGASVERQVEFLPEALIVHDELQLQDVAGAIDYPLPADWSEVSFSAEGAPVRRSGGSLQLRAAKGRQSLKVSGRWKV